MIFIYIIIILILVWGIPGWVCEEPKKPKNFTSITIDCRNGKTTIKSEGYSEEQIDSLLKEFEALRKQGIKDV